MGVRQWHLDRTRRRVAERFVAGAGLEIGALHRPWPVPATARVRYVDRHPAERLREEYPELAGVQLAEVELVDDAQTLATVPDASQDFVLAAHVLQHVEDPIGALKQLLRALRPEGVIVLALPDRRQGLDARRPPTSLKHVLADHAEGPERSRAAHYREWAELVDLPLGHVAAEDVAAHAAALERGGHDIHFHCWTLDELVGQLPVFGLPATVAAARRNHHEFLVVLRRTHAEAGPDALARRRRTG